MCVLFSVINTLVDLNWNLWKKKITLTLRFPVLKYEKSLKLEFCFSFFCSYSCSFFCVCVCVSKRICVLRSPCYGTGTWQRGIAAETHCERRATLFLCQNGHLEASWILYVTQTGVSHLQTGGKKKNNRSSFKDSCVLFFSLFFCLSCICFCIITVYGFCIKCIRVLGCKWNFIHILSKYLL